MPHQCMECKKIVERGSMDLKMGCPVCGCKKFQYIRPQDSPPTAAEYMKDVSSIEAAVKKAEMRIRAEEIKAAKPIAEEETLLMPVIKPWPIRCEESRIESVMIVEPGTYDINLEVLLNRKALVVAREEGNYFLDLPSAMKPTKNWRNWRSSWRKKR
ncbi:MAG TPA: Zn-ribbon containing protein [Methanocella sp.]|nr:Zn-ribbon containing protein [Methanocella sp.]